MTTTLHTFASLPADAREFWARTLQAQDAAGYFTGSPDWVELMAGSETATIAAVRDAQGQCCAVVPCLHRPWTLDARVLGRSLYRRELRTLKVGGGDLIAAGLDPAGLAAVLRDMLAQRPDADAIWFEHVVDATRREQLIAAARRSAAAFPVVLFRDLPHYRMSLPATLAEAMTLRSTKSHSRLRSKEKALARATGKEIRVVEIRTPADWVPYEERIERLINTSWQAQLLGYQFRLDSVRGTAERGWLRAFLLLAGEEPVAFTLYYQGLGTLVSALLAYDRQHARHSPGAILFHHTLQRLYAADQPRHLDFGEGDADYKRQWGNNEVPVSAVLIVRRRGDLRRQLALYRAARAADRAARRLLGLLGIDRLLARRAKMAAGADDGAAE